MRAQEIFDTVATHLFTQGRRAINDIDRCLYKTDSGLKCAVGCLIPDDMYSSKMENNDLITIIDRYTLPKYFARNQDMLSRLQTIHDEDYAWGTTEDMKDALKKVARNHHLKMSVLNNLSFEDR
jgi:hypothetical protein